MTVGTYSNLKSPPRLKGVGALVRRVLRDEHKNAEEITVVFVDDDYLLDVNRRFLSHNYKTDVIAFDLGEDGTIEGEIYVSVERARVQARRYRIPLKKELVRLIVHGVLHLAGWEDKTRSQKLRMRRRENEFIERLYVSRSIP
ncbi:MAG: rRNA maturation RNase YbeY [Bacteroidetes bacterium]|nr:rRNA maturation RNase YbeY [Bacteroidota bacterium]